MTMKFKMKGKSHWDSQGIDGCIKARGCDGVKKKNRFWI
jgi:hypothetical protein